MMPNSKPTDSSTANFALAMLRSKRTLVVALPWVVRACAQRCRPSGVLGPVLLPP